MPHGLPSMGDLKTYLQENLEFDDESEEDAWTLVRADLAAGDHLEGALEGKTLPNSLIRKIVELTWECVNEKDRLVFASAVSGDPFPLGRFVSGLFASTNLTVHVITTNYDRVAEYACNSVGVLVHTGFGPGYLQKWESGSQTRFYHGKSPARVVKIWKVHGSLDWFLTDGNVPVGIPTFELPEKEFDPLIVTPGLNKYEKIVEDPFRSTFYGADDALKRSAAIICVGYGFRDKQLHPKIEQRCREKNIPIVALARTLTDEAKTFLRERAGHNYLGLERIDGGSRAYTSKYPEGVDLKVHDLWSLEGFNNLVM